MRRLFAVVLLAVGLAPALAGAATAQPYPVRPVKIIVSYPAGGSNDVVARVIGNELSQTLGQSFVVESKVGAGGTIGADIAAKSAPDGYTLFMGAGAHTLAPSLYKTLPYDITKDFAPISIAASSAYLLVVHPSVPAHSVKELIALAKAKPGALNYASAGKGAPPHLAAELFKSMTGTDMVHVPYGGDTPAVNDLVAGNVQLSFLSISSTSPQVRAGRLRGLATTGAQRTPAMPDLPTLAEEGLAGYDVSTWWGLMAPAGTPAPIVAKLAEAMAQAVTRPVVKERFAPLGLDPASMTPEAFGTFIKTETARYAGIAKIAGIVPE